MTKHFHIGKAFRLLSLSADNVGAFERPSPGIVNDPMHPAGKIFAPATGAVGPDTLTDGAALGVPTKWAKGAATMTKFFAERGVGGHQKADQPAIDALLLQKKMLEEAAQGRQDPPTADGYPQGWAGPKWRKAADGISARINRGADIRGGRQ